MNMNDYQRKAITTDLFSGPVLNASDPAFVAKILGLVGESGEVADKFKKIIRDKGGVISDDNKTEMAKELGDVLWYVSALAHYMDIPLEQVAQSNLEKLSSRKARGVISGSGDNR